MIAKDSTEGFSNDKQTASAMPGSRGKRKKAFHACFRIAGITAAIIFLILGAAELFPGVFGPYGTSYYSEVDNHSNSEGHKIMAAVASNMLPPVLAQEADADPQGAINKYVLKAKDKEGDDYLLVCYKEPSGDHFDFTLNYVQADFTSIEDLRAKGINTNKPLKCNKYPFELLNIADRVKKLPGKIAGQKRVVFIGDAFTFGEGVPLGCAFPDAINHLLKLYGLSPEWSSVNFGRAGADFPVIYQDNFANAMKASPDVIVYVWTINNIPRPGKDPGGSPSEKDAGANDYPCPEARPSFTEDESNDKTLTTYRALYGKTNAAGMKEMRQFLARMNREAESAGVSFKVALFPVLEGKPGKYPLADVHKKMLDILAAEGIQAIDLAPYLMGTPAADLQVYDRDRKPNVEAHFTSALTLMSFLKMIDKDPVKEKSSPRVRKLENSCGSGFTWDLK
ncbi:MAG: hypothetical protein ABIH66_13675 [bacterium]